MIFEKVVNILTDVMEIDCDEIMPETELSAENGVERIDVVRLILECEKRFNITIYDEDVHTFKCVDDITTYIMKSLSENIESKMPSDQEREAWYY